MKSRKVFWFSGGLLALLGLSVVFQVVFTWEHPESAAKMAPDVIPTALPDVQIKDLDIGTTELVTKAVDDTLAFSDYRYREYRHGDVWFTVYVGYWQARKKHFIDLGTHAPDNCWVSNGWTMDPKLPKRVFTAGQFSVAQLSTLNPQHVEQTWPAEMRVFHANGETLYVAYWHLLAGEPLDYTRYGTGKTVGFLIDNLSHYWNGTAEQYFLRIASPVPLPKLEADSAFQAVLKSLLEHIPLERKQVE